MRGLICFLGAAILALAAAGCTLPPVLTFLWQPSGSSLLLQTNDIAFSDRWFYYAAATEPAMTSMEVTWKQLSGSPDAAHGVYFCLQDAANYYYLLVDSQRFYKLGKVVGGTETPIRAWTYSPLLAGMNGSNTVRITNNAGTFAISVDGVPLDSFQDTALAGGTEEFAAYIMPAAYEDFPAMPESFLFRMILPQAVP
jgi:hypothetical protein